MEYFHELKTDYDVAVVGAGPAGLMASRILAAAGYTVCLLDKRDPWREPVACAEAVHREGLKRLVGKIPENWIRGSVNGVIFVAPDGTRIRFVQKNSGLIIDRARMHRGMAESCVEAGVHCNVRARVKKIGLWDGSARILDIQQGDENRQIRAHYVVESSGPGSRLSDEQGMADGKYDLEAAVFALVKGIDAEPDFIEMVFSARHAPGGYAWIFPRGEGVANVGLVPGRRERGQNTPRALFERFLREDHPNAKVISRHGGPISCGQSRASLAQNGLFRAGDAADMVNPISRGGILEAMKGGKLAAENILRLLGGLSPAEEKKLYSTYLEKWMKVQGKSHLRLATAKPAFGSIPDDLLNRAAAKILRIPEKKRTLPRIFFTTLLSSPSLLWKMRSLMS